MRAVLLLEVLIAFFLVVLVAIPLIYPHVGIYRAQREFIHRIELDNAVNLLYADVITRLYKNEISFASLESTDPLPIDDDMLQRAHVPLPFPFKGSYSFKKTKEKPPGGGQLTFYLFQLTFSFKNPRQSSEKMDYVYDVFVTRQLKAGVDTPSLEVGEKK